MKTYGTRTKVSSQVKTLDTEHTSKLKRFDDIRGQSSHIDNEVRELTARCDLLERRGRQTLRDDELEGLLTMRDMISSLQRKRLEIDSHNDEISYYTETGAILFNYYDILENGLSTTASTTTTTTSHGHTTSTNATSECQALGQGDVIAASNVGAARGSGVGATSPPPPPNSILKWFHTSSLSPKLSTTNDRASLLDKYLAATDGSHIRSATVNAPEEGTTCPHCKSSNRTAMVQDGYIFCNGCFTVEYILVDHDKPSYKDPPKEITYFAYKRINHFNEWLNTVQGKETTLIPDEMFDKILLELKKLRITNLSELSNAKMKDILKKLRPEGGSRYYEHIPHIITKLNGLPTPHFPPELEERLRHMFCQIQVPFLKHACALNPARKNFLSYSYVLNKFMQLLEKDQYLSSFPLLNQIFSTSLGARVQEAMPVLVSRAA